MDLPGSLLILLALGIPVLIALALVALVRCFYRICGHEHVYKNGIVVTQTGIEYLGFLFTGTRKIAFSEIASVELLPYSEVAIRWLSFRYGLNTGRVPPSLFGNVLVVGFKTARPFRYLFFAPRDGAVICEQLKKRIDHESMA